VAKIKAGIVGLGVGEQHITGYQGHPDCEVAAICDLDKEKLDEVGERHRDLERTTDPDAVLENPDIDVVSVASFDNFHAEQILKAVRHGKHIFVEKPLCLYADEAEQIRSALEEKPHLQMSSNLILRRCPRFLSLKERIAEGRMGELFSVEGDYNYGRLHKITDGWRGEIDFYSVVYGGSVHLIDLILWLTGGRVAEVSAFGNQVASRGSQYRYNDFITALLKCESGLIIKVSGNYGCVYPHFHGLTVYGTKATFVNGRAEALLYTTRDPETEPESLLDDYPGYHKGDLIYRFVDAVLGQGKPEVTKEDVFRTMSVCFAIEKAMQENQVIPVQYI